MAFLSPVSLIAAAQPSFAGTCSGTGATLTDYGGGHMTFGGSQHCDGSDVTSVDIKIHAQRCTVQLFGCKSWGDVGSWVWKVRTGPGTVSDSHTMYGLACGNLYHTWAEGEGYNSGGRFYYGSAWSSNEVQYNC
jgi:hypothetical protein